MVWIQPLLLTLQLIAVAVLIAAVIGIVGAWAVSSLDPRRRIGRMIARLFLISMVSAVVMPMILHAAAWEATAGKFGWMFMTGSGARSGTSDTYGFFAGLIACGWIHGLVGGAIVALATWHGTRRTPSEVIDQSRLEFGPIAAWWRVRLPIASPWLVTSLLATAMLAATEMTVVDLYGYRSVADEFYLFYAVNPSVASILMTCFVPLALAGMILTWLLISRRTLLRSGRDSIDASAAADPVSIGWRCLAAFLAIALACLVAVVPALGLVIKLGHEVTVQNDLVQASWSLPACADRLFSAPALFAHEYRWTLIIAVVAGVAAVLIAWPMAAAGRTHPRLGRWIDPASILLVTLPGPIVALGVVSLFQTNLPGFRILYQQTLVPTVLALLVRSVPVAYWILRAGYRGIDNAIFDASRLDGTWLRRLWSVDRPLLRGRLLAAGLAAGVIASGDVPATLPVIPPGVSTVGTRLFGLLHSGARYQEAALAIWYVAAVALISLILIRSTSMRVRE